jgi:hypothetical protein
MAQARTFFEQVPVALAKRVEFRESHKHRPHHVVTCTLCKRPVNLQECKTDERGMAVHEECYVANVVRRGANSFKAGKD